MGSLEIETTVVDYCIFIWVVLFLLITFLYLRLFNEFCRRLKTDHCSVWERLGNPNNYSQQFKKVDKFIFKKEYLQISDQDFVSICTKMRFFRILLLVGLPVLILLILLKMIGK